MAKYNYILTYHLINLLTTKENITLICKRATRYLTF